MRKRYTEEEAKEMVRKSLTESDTKWREAVQQAFKDGGVLDDRPAARSRIIAPLPVPEAHTIFPAVRTNTLAGARRIARARARDLFGSTFRLEVHEAAITAEAGPPHLFSMVVTATKKERRDGWTLKPAAERMTFTSSLETQRRLFWLREQVYGLIDDDAVALEHISDGELIAMLRAIMTGVL
jgi:hypothetical protein